MYLITMNSNYSVNTWVGFVWFTSWFDITVGWIKSLPGHLIHYKEQTYLTTTKLPGQL